MDLNKCGKEGCNPVEQTRGNMKPEDHHMQFGRAAAAEQFVAEHGVNLPVAEFRRDVTDIEDQGLEHASDLRISCSKCGKATGWDRRDIEKFENKGPGDNRRVCVVRDGNVEAIRQRWNDLVK